MLTLNDGRIELWQWDTGRTLNVDADCTQVHFSNKVFGRSIDMNVVDGIAIIPDILLQTDKDLIAWAFVGTAENGYTKISKVFKVNKRNKPADYVFTPPEQTSLEEIKEKIEYLESIQDPDAIKNAVEDYLDRNPVEAPVQSVNGKTGKIKLTAEDVGAISQDDLQEATNEALAQAKESGEFDGKDGANGKDGKTPVKGIDYFDGQPGKDGEHGKDYVLTSADKEEIAELASELVEVPEGGGIAVTGAKVGQTVQIAAVDENGVPTAWLPTDFPSGVGGGKWELIAEGTVPEETMRVLIDKDINGNSFELVSWYLFAVLEPCENNGTGLVHTEVNYESVCVNKNANANATRYYQSRGEIICGYVAICAQSYSESTFNNFWEISNFTPKQFNFNGNNAKNISLYYGVTNNIAGANSKYVLYGVRA